MRLLCPGHMHARSQEIQAVLPHWGGQESLAQDLSRLCRHWGVVRASNLRVRDTGSEAVGVHAPSSAILVETTQNKKQQRSPPPKFPAMDFHFDGLGEASGRVEVIAGDLVSIKVQVRGIRRSLHLGNDVGCELHWACLDEAGGWSAPLVQPPGSRAVDPVASRIECKFDAVLAFPKDKAPKAIVFVVLVHGGGEHWLKAPGQQDFVVKAASCADCMNHASVEHSKRRLLTPAMQTWACLVRQLV